MFALPMLFSAVGTGLSFFGQRSAAKQQNATAMLNFQMQSQQIQQQREASGLQSAIQQTIASNEKAAMDRNAQVLEQQAGVATAAGNENMKRTRADYARILASQRAQLGASGVADTTGSPLQMLAFTAEEGQRAADETLFQTEQQRRNLFREADNQRAQGLAAEMDIYGAQARGGAAKLQASNAMAQAQMDLASVRQNSAAMKRSAWGELIGGIGGLVNQAHSTYRRTPRTGAGSFIS